MSIAIATCAQCGNKQQIIVPVRHDPICRNCKKPMGYKQ